MNKYTGAEWATVIGLIVVLVVVCIAIGSVITGGIIYAAWNFAIAPIFGVKAATFLQAWLIGLLVATVGGAFKGVTAAKAS